MVFSTGAQKGKKKKKNEENEVIVTNISKIKYKDKSLFIILASTYVHPTLSAGSLQCFNYVIVLVAILRKEYVSENKRGKTHLCLLCKLPIFMLMINIVLLLCCSSVEIMILFYCLEPAFFAVFSFFSFLSQQYNKRTCISVSKHTNISLLYFA